MIKRLLAFILIGCMMLESMGLTTYAETAAVETVSGNEEEPELLVADTEKNEEMNLTALSVGTDNTLNLPAYDSENDAAVNQWYTFTAPQDGIYNFFAGKNGVGKKSWIYLYKEQTDEEYISYGSVNTNTDLNIQTGHLLTGETIYVRAYTEATEEIALNVEIYKIAEYNLAKQEQGGYIAGEDSYGFYIDIEAGYKYIRGTTSISAKEGQELDDTYRVKMYYRDKASESESSYSMLLYSRRNYIHTFAFAMSFSSEYDFYFVLEEYETKKPLAIYNGDISVVTGTTDAKYVITDTIVSEDSIIFDMENYSGGYCFYAPVEGSVEELKKEVNVGWYKLEFTGLQSETAYYFEFTDKNYNTLGVETVTTLASEIEITYKAELSTDGTKFLLSTDVSKYKGTANTAYLCYEYTDALGRVQTLKQEKSLTDVEDTEEIGKPFAISAECTPLVIGSTTYDIKMWLEMNGVTYEKVTKQLTTPEAMLRTEDVSFQVTGNEENTEAVYSLEIANCDSSLSGTIFYKPQASSGSDYKKVEIKTSSEANTANGVITDIQQGMEYKYILFIGGVKKEINLTVGSVSLSLVPVGETEINAFDFVKTYKLESEGALEQEYSLSLYCMEEGATEYTLFGTALLNAENEYQVTFSTAATNIALIPNMEYQIKWVISTNYSDSDYVEKLVTYEKLQTSKAALTFEVEKNDYNSQSYKISLDKESVANFSTQKTFLVHGYIRKEGEERYRNAGYVYLRSSSAYVGTLNFTGLEENTKYELSMRDEKSNEYATFSFLTLADTRTVEVTSVTTAFRTAEIRYTLSGMGTTSGYVYLFIREKGTESEWEKVSHQSYSGSDKSSFWEIDSYGEEKLKDATTYEYRVGLSYSYDSTCDELEKVIAGEFATPEDTRELTVTSIDTGRQSATLYYSLDGMDIVSRAIILCYIREKGSDSDWGRANYVYAEGENGNFTMQIEYTDASVSQKLTEGTTYEFQIGFGDKIYPTLSSMEKVVTGQFTTKKENRTLTAEVTAGYVTADIIGTLNGNDFNNSCYIHYFCKQKDAAEWEHIGYDIMGQVSGDLNKKVTGLEPNTTYEYAVLLPKDYRCSSPDDEVIAECKVMGEFMTKTNSYTLDFAANESKTTHDKAVITVTAKGSREDAVLNIGVTLSDGQYRTVNLKRGSGYTKEITFSGLDADTEYVISNVAIHVTENNKLIAIGNQSCDYKFTTKKKEVPTAISLDVEEISLNAAYGSKYMEGFSSKTLKIAVEPAGVPKSFAYGTSNPSIVTVNADGVITAVAPGEATVSVSAPHDASINAVCKVIVKNYAIGYTNTRGKVQISKDSNDSWTIYKNGSLEGFGFYEVGEDGSKTLLTDYSVTPVKEGIVTWSDGKFQAIGVGETRVDFEKDGVKAAIYIKVSVAGKGFDIIGFEASDTEYPAIKNEDGSYTLACLGDNSYKAIGEISPEQTFYASNFTWSTSDSAIARVNASGKITPLTQGDVVITATPKGSNDKLPYVQKEVTVTLHIKGLPTEENGNILYAVANISNKIGDVSFPDSWGEGWSWKYPDMPLVTNKVNADNYYNFEAVYQGDDGYPCETTLQVYIGRITGVTVFEEDSYHNHILEAGGKDSIKLGYKVETQGKLNEDVYTFEIPQTEGLTITKHEEGYYTVTAQKTGKYTLKPIVKSGATVVATGSYKITVVEEKQAAEIIFSTDTEGVTITENKVIFEDFASKKDFSLNATVKDRYGEELETKLKWKTTDKSVATVTVDKKDTHSARITVKEEGHAVITVTAKDKTTYQAELDIEIQNHAPRVNTDKVTINNAFDYDNYDGRILASGKGMLEVIPVYDEAVNRVWLCDEGGKNTETRFKLVSHGAHCYVVSPIEATEIGTYNCVLRVKTSSNTYNYPIKVSVVDEKPTVTAKMNNALNLFYTNTTATFDLKMSKDARVKSVSWKDEAKGINNGFSMSASSYYRSGKLISTVTISQQKELDVMNGVLKDNSVTKGTLSVKLVGYKDAYVLENFAVKYTYKKPALVTKNATTNIAPDLGQNWNRFYLYDKTSKSNILYAVKNASDSKCFNEINCETENVELTCVSGSSEIKYIYTGENSTEKITFTVDSTVWREAVQTTHTIKVNKPKAVLFQSAFTYNTNAKNTLSAYIYLNNKTDISYTDVVIKGANAKAQSLLAEDLFIITSIDNRIDIKQSDASIMGTSIPAGTYKYKLTPYYTSALTGEKTALNTLTMTLKVVDKPVTAKVNPKGKLDLASGSKYSVSAKKNAVWIDPKFANRVDGYSVVDYELVGEYSDYFEMGYESGHYYVTINGNYLGKLKAGQNYKLAVRYTMQTTEGETFMVTSNTFKIKPNQSRPKITVSNNNQTFYAAAKNVPRNYQLSTSEIYTIESASGSLDCNKDGKADVLVSGDTVLNVQIVDCDAVGASAKGKTYTIPVTVRLVGADGIGKDATVNIKIKVKR